MSLTDLTNYSTILSITTDYGAADTSLSGVLSGTDSAVTKLKSARTTAKGQLSADSDWDYLSAWISAIQSTQSGMSAKITPLLDTAVKAIDTYYKAEGYTGLKGFWKTKNVDGSFEWTAPFRILWRRVQSEELAYRIGTVTRAGGGWAVSSFTANGTLAAGGTMIDTAFEVRVLVASTTAAAITVTCTLTKANGGTEIITLTIPSGTTNGTVFALSNDNASKFNGVYTADSGSTYAFTVAGTGGATADSIQLWVK